jgi:hypothetical protein
MPRPDAEVSAPPHPLLFVTPQIFLPGKAPTDEAAYQVWLSKASFSAYSIFWAGITLGVSNLASG